MNSLQERIYNPGHRMQAFLITNDAVLGTINKSGMRADLDAIVDALGDSGGQQAAGRVNAIGVVPTELLGRLERDQAVAGANTFRTAWTCGVRSEPASYAYARWMVASV